MDLGWGDAQSALQRLLEGRYTLHHLLEKGGVAEVFLASYQAPDRRIPCAIKTLRPLMALDDEICAMFRDEIRLFRRLSHPHVVRYFEGDGQSCPPYLAMEYIEGCDLAQLQQWLATQGEPPAWELAVEIGLALLRALDYLHNARALEGEPLGLIHRDLSPPNVLLGVGGEIKLTDFGIAIFQDMSRDTSGTDPKGKFAYLAPELLQQLPIDQRADIFAWGIITWELLTGRSLFSGATPEETLMQVQSAPIPEPRQWNPAIPEGLEALVMGALQRDRERRPSRVTPLREALEQLAARHTQGRCPVEQWVHLAASGS